MQHALCFTAPAWPLAHATLGWNVVGTIIILIAAGRTGSAALAGFGLDSGIEIFASVVVVWQLKGLEQGRESLSLKLIGTAFIALAVYIFAQSVWTLLSHSHPAPSPLGIIWLAVTCAVMLLLAWRKLATGRQLGNLVLTSEARVTLIDAALAGAVLIGVGLNARSAAGLAVRSVRREIRERFMLVWCAIFALRRLDRPARLRCAAGVCSSLANAVG
jgi:divalent metal cation (Fe/Co/Zn/Cd) transporter